MGEERCNGGGAGGSPVQIIASRVGQTHSKAISHYLQVTVASGSLYPRSKELQA